MHMAIDDDLKVGGKVALFNPLTLERPQPQVCHPENIMKLAAIILATLV